METYNSELAALENKDKNTWFSCPWLYAEYVNFHFGMPQTDLMSTQVLSLPSASFVVLPDEALEAL